MKKTSVPCGAGEAGEVERGRVVAGDDRELRGEPAVRDRDPGRGRHGGDRRHAGHDLERDARPRRARAPPPRPGRTRTGRRPSAGRRGGRRGRAGRAARSISSWPSRARPITSACGGASATSSRRDEPVVDEHVAACGQLEPADGDQPGVAGARADEEDGHRSARSSEVLEELAPLARRWRGCASPTAAARAARARSARTRAASCAASSRRIRFASAGDAPPVETASAIGPSRCTEGRISEQRSGVSTALQKIAPRARRPRRSAGRPSSSAVAATTRKRPSRSAGPVLALDQLDVERAQLGDDPRRDDGDLARPRRAAPATFSSATGPPPTTRHAAPVEVEARHVVAVVARQADALAIRAPCRSSRSDSSRTPCGKGEEECTRPDRLQGHALEAAALERGDRVGHGPGGLAQLAPARKLAVEPERGLLAAGPVERAQPAALQAQLEQLLERLGVVARDLAVLDGGDEVGQPAAALARPARARARPAPRRARPRRPRRARRTASARHRPPGARAARARSRRSRSRSGSRTPWARSSPTTSGRRGRPRRARSPGCRARSRSRCSRARRARAWGRRARGRSPRPPPRSTRRAGSASRSRRGRGRARPCGCSCGSPTGRGAGPVIQASRSPSRRVSGCTLRTLQQSSRFSTEARKRFGPLRADEPLAPAARRGRAARAASAGSARGAARSGRRSPAAAGPCRPRRRGSRGRSRSAMSRRTQPSTWNAVESAIRGEKRSSAHSSTPRAPRPRTRRRARPPPARRSARRRSCAGHVAQGQASELVGAHAASSRTRGFAGSSPARRRAPRRSAGARTAPKSSPAARSREPAADEPVRPRRRARRSSTRRNSGRPIAAPGPRPPRTKMSYACCRSPASSRAVVPWKPRSPTQCWAQACGQPSRCSRRPASVVAEALLEAA